MTYRVRGSYEPEDGGYLQYGQSTSVANIHHLTTLQRGQHDLHQPSQQQHQHQQQYYEDQNGPVSTELHRYGHNADRFTSTVRNC